jgi:Xaa-Pro dipeptidase
VEVRDDSSGVLEPGMVFHLPISLRYEGQYGVAVSETVAIVSDGVRVLTNLDRELVVK